MPKSQKQMILDWMQAGHRINKIDAIKLFDCYVLAQRIDNIEDDIRKGLIPGWKLCRERIKDHHNACEYWLEPLYVQQELFPVNTFLRGI